MAIAVPMAFHLCCCYFSGSAVLIVGIPFPFRAGCGIRFYRFLIIAFLSTLVVKTESESELLLVTRSNDNHSPGPVMREVSP